MFTIIRSLTVILVLGVMANPAGAAQQGDGDLLNRVVPENCMAYLSWSGLGVLNPNGNPTEKWLAQDEIQLTLKKLFAAIQEYQELHPVDDEPLNEFLMKVPVLLKDCQVTVYFGEFNEKTGLEKSGYGGVVVKLNQHEDWASNLLKKFVEIRRQNQGIMDQDVDGNPFYVSPIDDEEAEMHLGIMQGHFVMTFGIDALEKALANLKTPAPGWLGIARTESMIDRTLGFFRFDLSSLHAMDKKTGPDDRIPEFLKIEEIQSISGAIGLDDQGFIASAFVRCPENTTGLMSILSSNSIDEMFIEEIPNGQMGSTAARFSLPSILKLVNSFATTMNDDSVNDVILEIESLTNMDFETEIVDSFDGTFSSYQNLSPLTMSTTGVISLKVKNAEQFAERLAKFNKELKGEARALELGEFIEKESNGQKIYSLMRPPFAGSSFSWCHVDEQLYVSVDAKSISTHLRKRGRTKNRLIDDARFKQSLDYGVPRGWGKPIAFSHIDVATMLELLVPLAQTFLVGQEIPDFDFTVEDIPSVDVLVNGVEANMIVVFRTNDGFHLIERSTLPGGSSVATTGIAIGMLLPAVQQVRHAARRATTMNNLQQLQLAVLNYESANQRFPPAYSTDEDGKPLLSWRVHILPYLEEGKLYEQFHLDEPWDSPHNKTLIDKMPKSFENLSAVLDQGQTTFLGAGGKNGVFSGDEGTQFRFITDGSSNTISILDVNSQNSVVWTAPDDFNPDEVEDILGATKGNWPGIQVIAVMADASCHTLRNYSNEELKHLMGRDDGVIVELDR